MRTHFILSAVIGLLTLHAGALYGDTVEARIAQLIQQLGNEAFAKREAASKELEEIGEPALPALRKAVASDNDPEIRQRAGHIAQSLVIRLRLAAGKKELLKCEGSWQGDPGVTMTIKGDRFTSFAPGIGNRNGTIAVVEVGEKVLHVDMFIDEGDVKGQTFKAIFRLDGAMLHYCGTYSGARPVEFKSKGANCYIGWKQTK